MQKQKLRIRLPTDPGPNPYAPDAKFEDRPENAWAFKADWWVSVIIGGIGIGLVGWWKSTH